MHQHRPLPTYGLRGAASDAPGVSERTGVLDTRSLVGTEAVVSYTQNAEDVRLLRVFRTVSDGFYVDVGAGNPTVGSATRLFYERGWSGINVEPGPEYTALARERPRDINIEAAVGEADGTVPFFVTYPDPGLSTLDLATHSDVPDAFEWYEEVAVRQLRLESILRRHAAGRTIHFLKIDVEGAEHEVIASCDWREFRPIVVLVEAIEPWSTSPTHERWEPMLLDADYELAVFDGVNRFYVAAEHRELAPALSYPISALDRYTPAELSESREQLEALSSKYERLWRENADVSRANEQLWHENERHSREKEQLLRENARLRNELEAVYRSRTWHAGRIAAITGKPATALVRRLRQHRPTAPASPEREYRALRRDGQPWYFPPRGRRHRGQQSALDRLLQELGPPREELDVPRALGLQRSIEQLGWTDEDSLHGRRLTRAERQAVVEVDSLTHLVTGATSRAGHAGSAPSNPTVVVDARCLQSAAYRDRGVGAHARSVLRAAREGTRGMDLLLLVDAELPDLPPEVVGLADALVWSPLERPVGTGLFLTLSPMTASCAPATPYLAAAECRTVALLYDVIPGEYPSAYLASAASALAYRARLESLRHYDLLLAISEASADACRRLLDDDLRTVVTGVGDPLRDVAPAPFTREEPFVLVVAGADPRKNAAAGVAALARLARDGTDPVPRLVVTGILTRAQADALHDLARRTGLPDNALERVGVVDAERLAALYDSAALVVVPSFAEGFSLPVVEALARGTPVAVSDIAPHRELVGDGPWLAAPDDVSGLADAITHVLASREDVLDRQRASVGDAGDPAAVRARVVDAVRDILREPAALAQRPRTHATRARIALVTPFPPQASGVADYTASTFREVAKHADVDVYTAASASPDSSFTLFPLSSAPFLDLRYERVVGVVGNSHFHFPVVDLLEAFGGACIAHDVTMVEAHGWDDPETSSVRGQGSGYGVLARVASPLVVHSHALADVIVKETGVMPVVVPFVPYRVPSEPAFDASSVARSRRALGLGDDAVHVATFGFVDRRTKGHDTIVGALAWLAGWDLPVHLHVVGDAPPGELVELSTLAGELGVSESVTFHGRVPAERLELFLRAIDVAIQIRTSGRLTLSGTAADCFAFGAPTVTTDDLAAELDAPSYVATVPPEASSLLLAEAMERLISLRREQPNTIEGERVAYLARRSVASYAGSLLDALEIDIRR
jgi:FkbM family methyltransferase